MHAEHHSQRCRRHRQDSLSGRLSAKDDATCLNTACETLNVSMQAAWSLLLLLCYWCEHTGTPPSPAGASRACKAVTVSKFAGSLATKDN
jgi:hypothetical protein